MINNDRIVPVTVTDLLTLYGNILTIAGTTIDSVQATNPGIFEVEDATNTLIAADPVAKMDFAEDVTAATVYFIPAYNYAGFSLNGVAVATAGDTVDPDGRTLYTATLADSAVTIAKVGF